jgi:hypothetical protein
VCVGWSERMPAAADFVPDKLAADRRHSVTNEEKKRVRYHAPLHYPTGSTWSPIDPTPRPMGALALPEGREP